VATIGRPDGGGPLATGDPATAEGFREMGVRAPNLSLPTELEGVIARGT
jgi:hypothetical protein